MKRKMNGKEYELKFTFNSILYLEDFNIEEMNDLTIKPFKVLRLTSELLHGALNHDDEKVVSIAETRACLQSVTENGEISELFAELLELLQESDFFKNLQEKSPEGK